jgi:alpha-N-acetylglucosaminidase
MRYLNILVGVLLGATGAVAQYPSTEGIYNLVQRRIPQHADSFQFSLVNATLTRFSASGRPNDQYVVSTSGDGKVLVEGNSLSALASGYVLPRLMHIRMNVCFYTEKAC